MASANACETTAIGNRSDCLLRYGTRPAEAHYQRTSEGLSFGGFASKLASLAPFGVLQTFEQMWRVAHVTR